MTCDGEVGGIFNAGTAQAPGPRSPADRGLPEPAKPYSSRESPFSSSFEMKETGGTSAAEVLVRITYYSDSLESIPDMQVACHEKLFSISCSDASGFKDNP